MDKKYNTTEHLINGVKITVHDPCITDEDQEDRQKRFEKACGVFMERVTKERIKKKSQLLQQPTFQNKTFSKKG